VKGKTGSKAKGRRIIITDGNNSLPYSKGLMASAFTATGMLPSKSYKVAELIQDKLRAKGVFSLTAQELNKLSADVLTKEMGKEYAEKFLKWHALSKLDKPLIILIGGGTGVGKSTIATEVAHRLGIRRIVQTDAIREVMRAVFSYELMPTLYYSSFEAWRGLRPSLAGETDSVIAAFEDQVSTVNVGLHAVIERAMRESLNVILEGVHLVPGVIDLCHFADAFVLQIVIKVEDPRMHKSHFYVRDPGLESHRSFKRYLENFENIRRIGDYIEARAVKTSNPVVPSYSLDATVSSILEVVYNAVFDTENALSI
jgi:2-phosphoglycerate kinase